jgi:hypothetical protein
MSLNNNDIISSFKYNGGAIQISSEQIILDIKNKSPSIWNFFSASGIKIPKKKNIEKELFFPNNNAIEQYKFETDAILELKTDFFLRGHYNGKSITENIKKDFFWQ